MLDTLGFITLTTYTAAMIAVGAFALQAERRTQVAVAIGLSLWFGIAAAAGAAGLLAAAGRAPVMGAFVAAPLIAAAVAALFPDGRRVLTSLPLNVILALNVGRVLGIFFVILGWVGRLGGPFPVSAGWGDVISGVVALGLLAIGFERRRGLVLAWNLFGFADLVAAIVLGVLSSEGAPQQLIHTPPGSAAMQHLPWSYVPSVLVPYLIVMHAIVWAQLRRKPAAA